VKVLPPSRGKLDCVVMLFDSPADPRLSVADDVVCRARRGIDARLLRD
jgi:hypothetical protein